MALDDGEALFERYLKARAYGILAYHPDLGTPKRPDYLISDGHRQVVVEVESFNRPPLSVDHLRNGCVSMVPQLKAVRNKITAGAKQLKGIENYPLVVVLANPRNSWVPLEGAMFLGALFGDMQYSFLSNGEGILRAGRNGRLYVAEPDGSTHGNHPYLSAVAVLRLCYSQDAWGAAMSKAQEIRYTHPLAVIREANRLVTKYDETAVEGICLDVYETVSKLAVPLPRDIFDGPEDTRWGVTAVGEYDQIDRPPDRKIIMWPFPENV